jgi:hypothetical protein
VVGPAGAGRLRLVIGLPCAGADQRGRGLVLAAGLSERPDGCAEPGSPRAEPTVGGEGVGRGRGRRAVGAQASACRPILGRADRPRSAAGGPSSSPGGAQGRSGGVRGRPGGALRRSGGLSFGLPSPWEGPAWFSVGPAVRLDKGGGPELGRPVRRYRAARYPVAATRPKRARLRQQLGRRPAASLGLQAQGLRSQVSRPLQGADRCLTC